MTNVKPAAAAEEADLRERINGFNKELLPLLGKYELGLAAIAKITQDGRIAADPVIVSVRQRRKEAATKASDAKSAAQTPRPKVDDGGLVEG